VLSGGKLTGTVEFSITSNSVLIENKLIYPNSRGSQLIFFAPFRAGGNEENQ